MEDMNFADFEQSDEMVPAEYLPEADADADDIAQKMADVAFQAEIDRIHRERFYWD